jgi:hypothetical protein
METSTKTDLESVAKITVPKVEEFLVGEKFKHLSKEKNDLKLNLDKHFIRLVLEPMKDRRLSLVNPVELEKFKLTGEKEMKRSEIKKELGGETTHLTASILLPVLLSFLSNQSNGEEKDDLYLSVAHSYRNSFTVQLDSGSTIDVVLTWDDKKKYWSISVPQIEHDPSWIAGRVFFIIPLPF